MHSPIAEFTGQTIAKRIGLSPILRAGIGMTDGECYEYERCRPQCVWCCEGERCIEGTWGNELEEVWSDVVLDGGLRLQVGRKEVRSEIADQHLRGAGHSTRTTPGRQANPSRELRHCLVNDPPTSSP